jgi:hypothetical protein
MDGDGGVSIVHVVEDQVKEISTKVKARLPIQRNGMKDSLINLLAPGHCWV